MLSIDLFCVGGLKEAYWKAAAAEYVKRLGAWARVRTVELREQPLGASASPAEVRAALAVQGERLLALPPKDACACALCVEGRELSSEALAAWLEERVNAGSSHLCFFIGGSHGLDEAVKARAELRLSLSRMTLPHMLARVFLLEQLYRAFCIREGRLYHK